MVFYVKKVWCYCIAVLASCCQSRGGILLLTWCGSFSEDQLQASEQVQGALRPAVKGAFDDLQAGDRGEEHTPDILQDIDHWSAASLHTWQDQGLSTFYTMSFRVLDSVSFLHVQV